jgi:hypothetical protein
MVFAVEVLLAETLNLSLPPEAETTIHFKRVSARHRCERLLEFEFKFQMPFVTNRDFACCDSRPLLFNGRVHHMDLVSLRRYSIWM